MLWLKGIQCTQGVKHSTFFVKIVLARLCLAFWVVLAAADIPQMVISMTKFTPVAICRTLSLTQFCHTFLAMTTFPTIRTQVLIVLAEGLLGPFVGAGCLNRMRI
jgi:hypothetical protein